MGEVFKSRVEAERYRKEALAAVRSLVQVTRTHALYVLNLCQGDVILTAKHLGIGKTTLYRWLRDWDEELDALRKQP